MFLKYVKYQPSKSAGKFPLNVKEWLEGDTQKKYLTKIPRFCGEHSVYVDVNRAAYHYFSNLQKTL